MKFKNVFVCLVLVMCLLTSSICATAADAVSSKAFSASKDAKSVKISFNIADVVDTNGVKTLSVVAANYKAGALIATKVVSYDVAQSLSSNQSIEIAGDADKTKLFLYADKDRIIALPTYTVDKYNSENKKETPTLFLVGDSICIEYKAENQYPQQGWGAKIDDMLENINVKNCAQAGYSTATYLVYDRYAKAYAGKYSWNSDKVITSADGNTIKDATPILPMIKEGDYVIVSLGINDGYDITRTQDDKGQTTAATYKKHLKQFIDDTRAKGAEIILVTPTTNGRYKTGTTQYVENYSGRAGLMVQVAKENNVVCLELGAEMAKKYNTMTEAEVKKNHMVYEIVKDQIKVENTKHNNSYVKKGEDDTTHLSETGAEFVAKLIVDMLKETDSGLKQYIKD